MSPSSSCRAPPVLPRRSSATPPRSRSARRWSPSVTPAASAARPARPAARSWRSPADHRKRRGAGTSEQLSGLIQTNADIQPGDSGGPLVNTAGQVIGMDTAALGQLLVSARHDPGLRHPGGHRDGARRADRKPRRLGHRAHRPDRLPRGRARAATPGGSASAASPARRAPGVIDRGVVSGTPAAQAGLAAGDTIVSVDGQSVDSPTALTTAAGRLPARGQGHDRLDRRIGRATHKHRDACLGAGALSRLLGRWQPRSEVAAKPRRRDGEPCIL